MERPYVFVNMAMTVDGKIAAADRENLSLGTEADRREMDRLRAEADVVLWGGETLRVAGVPALIRDPSLQEGRRKAGRPPQPANGVVTASGHLSAESGWFGPSEVVRFIFTSSQGAPVAREAARGRADVVSLGEGRVPAGALLEHLAARGFRRVLLEGGGGLHWTFIEEGLVDAVHITLTPWLAGGENAPTVLDGEGFSTGRFQSLRLEEVRREGDELFLRYCPRKGRPPGSRGGRERCR